MNWIVTGLAAFFTMVYLAALARAAAKPRPWPKRMPASKPPEQPMQIMRRAR